VVVNLERTSKELLITQELHELFMIFCAATDEIDGLATRSTVFDVLAAIVEAALVFFGPNVVQFGHQSLTRLFFCLRDIDEERLIRRTCEGTENVEEVVSTGRTGRDNSFG